MPEHLLASLPEVKAILPKHTDSGPEDGRTEDVNRIYLAVTDGAAAFLEHKVLEIIPQEYSEAHDENCHVHSTLSDSVVVFATGAEIVTVTLDGRALVTEDFDDLVDLLGSYKRQYRARNMQAGNSRLRLVMQDVSMAFIVDSLQVGYSVDAEGYVSVQITGRGYDFVIDGYDGRAVWESSGVGVVPETTEGAGFARVFSPGTTGDTGKFDGVDTSNAAGAFSKTDGGTGLSGNREQAADAPDTAKAVVEESPKKAPDKEASTSAKFKYQPQQLPSYMHSVGAAASASIKALVAEDNKNQSKRSPIFLDN